MSQSSNDYELLVIDDGSTDHTGAIAGNMAEKNSSISIVRIPHSGAGAARNEGVRRARGKYVIFLDADDYWTNPGLLEHLREKLHHREVDVVMSQMDKFNPYYIMLQMDWEAQLLVINQVLCIVDYQPDGMSSRVFRQYEDSPVSFGMLRLQFRQMPDIPFWFRYRQCMHYVSSWLFAVKQHRSDLRAPFFIGGMLLAFLPGVLLHLYIIFRNRRDHK
ncbi:glycosyltransferase [Mediterraneibacter glycyrrhizinilyticus]|nr:glycosyltransferase [Mediterraneibacter glycyrrhizinilyticus]MCF2569074.1 glycosyltransferase [Mediterraneibacter glycyrrhizinilyticus]